MADEKLSAIVTESTYGDDSRLLLTDDPDGTPASVYGKLGSIFKSPPGYTSAGSYKGFIADNYARLGSTTVAITTNQSWYFPMRFLHRAAVDGIVAEVVTGQASALARIGVYEMLSDGEPGALLQQTGTIDVSSSGVKSVAWSDAGAFNIMPGWYFICFTVDTASVTWDAGDSTFSSSWMGALGGGPENPITVLRDTLTVSPTLDDPAGAIDSALQQNIPMVMMRVA